MIYILILPNSIHAKDITIKTYYLDQIRTDFHSAHASMYKALAGKHVAADSNTQWQHTQQSVHIRFLQAVTWGTSTVQTMKGQQTGQFR